MKALAKAVKEARKQWDAMCAYDNIPVNSMFAVFSNDNPHAEAHRKAMAKVFRLRAKAVR